MAESLGYSFDKVQLKRGGYSPVGHLFLDMPINQQRDILVGEILEKIDQSDLEFIQKLCDDANLMPSTDHLGAPKLALRPPILARPQASRA